MIDENALNILYHVVASYQAMLAVLGTIGSIIVFTVAFRLRKTTTFVFIMFLAVADAMSLYFWNLDNLVNIYTGYWFQEENLYGCKLINYFQFVSMQSSAWLLILLSIDRFMSVWLKTWKTTYFQPKRAFIAGAVCVSVFVLLNFNVWFTFGHREYNENGTYTDYCDSEMTPTLNFMNNWYIVHAVFYLYVPYVAIVLANAALVFFLKMQQRRSAGLVKSNAISTHANNNKSSVNNTVITITLLFVLMTFPTSLGNAFFSYLNGQDWGYLVIVLCDCVAYTYHAMGFVILMLTNTRFRAEFSTLLNSLGIKSVGKKI